MRETSRRFTKTSAESRIVSSENIYRDHSILGAWIGLFILVVDIVAIFFLLSLLGPSVEDGRHRAPAPAMHKRSIVQ